MKHSVSAALALTLSLAGCSAQTSTPSASAEPAPRASAPESKSPAKTEKSTLTQTKFGQPITEGAATELASIAVDPQKFAGQKVRTEGVVKAVCKAAGCWMEIEDASGRAHVKMAGHSFYVPKNADGHRARVEGTVQGGPPKDECGAKDSCGGENNGALAQLEIEATGVEFVD